MKKIHAETLDGANRFMVGVGIRVIPAGVTRWKNGKLMMRASLVLSPIAAESAVAACGKAIDIRQWPQRIEDILNDSDEETPPDGKPGNLTVLFSPVTDGENAATPSDHPAKRLPAFRAMYHRQSALSGKPMDLNAWSTQRYNDVMQIRTMWADLVAPGGDDDWKTIVEALKASSAEAGLRGLKPDSAAAAAPANPAVPSVAVPAGPGGAVPAPPAQPKGPPDIRSIGRGQAALLLSLERGRSLLERAKNYLDGKPCLNRDDECNLASPLEIPRNSYLTEQERQAAGPENSKARQDAENAARLKFEAMTDEDRKKEEDRLRRDEEAVRLKFDSMTDEQRKKEEDRQRKADMAVRSDAANKAQSGVKEAYDKITGAGTRAERVAAYRKLLDCTTADDVAACFAKSASPDQKPLAKAIDASIDRHNDAVHEEDGLPDVTPENRRNLKQKHDDKQREKAPQMRLTGLQSQPSLARAFNLVVDVLVPFEMFSAADAAGFAKAYPERRGVAGTSRFGFMSAALECRAATRRVWTACKVRLPEDVRPKEDGAEPDVWACTRAELDLLSTLSTPEQLEMRDALIAAGTLSQLDGVVNLAAARSKGGSRFDIVSLDAAQAVENRQTVKVGAQPGTPPLVTLRTVGLALIDRWRDTSALTQALNSLAREQSTEQVIDADDLTVGYRMDVAVKSSQTYIWRSLCNRWIRFGDEKHDIEPILRRVIPDPADRLAYDSAIVVMPAKIRPKDDFIDHDTAHVEDTVGHWTGPPIGVDANSSDIQLSRVSYALQLGHLYSLAPDPRYPQQIPPQYTVFRQIFGGGYHLGLTPRLQGGVIRPFKDGWFYRPRTANGANPDGAERYFAMLPSPFTGPRRFLRHERIEAPVVTTPEPILRKVFDGVADGLRETAGAIVVRTRPSANDPKTYLPFDSGSDGKASGTSHRVVVPPSVSAIFADRHGVFGNDVQLATYRDCGSATWQAPVDGLADVDYDQPTGGFPVYGYTASSEGRLEVAADPVTKPSGDAVFRPRGKKTARRDPYFPDPAASYIVIALRDAAGRLLPGDPLVVPVRPEGVAYPNVRPIAIDVVAMPARSGKPPNHQRIVGLQAAGAKGGYLRGSDFLDDKKRAAPTVVMIDGGDRIAAGGGVAASRVQVALEPGESVEIDLWCLPTVDNLARWFDVIESAALVASVDRDKGETCSTCETFATRLKNQGLDTLADFVQRLGLSRATANAAICGPGQAKMPAGALRCVADLAQRVMRSQVAPEIAARTTIVATHAIAQTYAAPAIALSVSRKGSVSESASEPGTVAQTVEINGIVRVDRQTTGLFEVRAQAASLVSNAFDDEQRRRRTPDEVARGLWPRSPVTNERMAVKSVYGFEVAADGSVTLPGERTTLLRVDDDIAVPEALVPGWADRDIAELRERAGETGSGNVVRMNQPFTISDSRARVVKLWAVTGSRTASYFRDDKGDVAVDALAAMKSPEQTLVVQATKAPAKVAPLTILPAFRLESDQRVRNKERKFVMERKVRLRIRMRRPWFSSGEGERLGIVLWPPDILRGRVIPGGAGVSRDYDVAPGEKADVAMKQFEDEDLGPGGSFVTRWGLDPTKGGGQLGWMVPPAAFADLDEIQVDGGNGDTVLPPGPIYVPRASVPIPIDDGAAGARQSIRLETALLTYVPGFDIDHETWFCDVELRAGTAPEPFMRLGLVRYQPYAPPELRVSEPVVEWVQIPQHRSVSVSIDRRRRQQLDVVVTGTGSTYSAAAPTGYDPTRIESWTQQPVMKITVLRRRADGIEDIAELDGQCGTIAPGSNRRAERTWIPRKQTEWRDALTLGSDPTKTRPLFAVRPTDPGETTALSWSAGFLINEDPLKPKIPGMTYAVLVEEVVPMLPATYSDEPVEPGIAAPEDRQELVFSGPRFAAVIELKASDQSDTKKDATSNKAVQLPVAARKPKKRALSKPIAKPDKAQSSPQKLGEAP